MKNRVTILLTLLLLAVVATPLYAKKKSSKEKFDVYLLIGQSNMAGRGYMIPSDTLNSMEGVYLLNMEGEVVEARNPLNQYSTIRKNYSMQQMSPAYSFATKLHRESGRKILLVVNARGGSSISEWAPDNDSTKFYSEAVRRTRQAMEYGELKGVLWHQGCADSGEGSRRKYIARLQNLVTNLRSDLDDKRLYFVAGELAYWRESSAAFNEMLHTMVDQIPYSDYISAEGATMRTDAKDPHFSREGQLLLGERYADKVLTYIYKL
ncbi:MAG: sialate O-acetylesterase [Rikenellaceae bacterium]